MRLYNTLTRTIQEFTPMDADDVRMYACGPTVYDYTHIGHVRKFINDDILRRALEINGFSVRHVMNITDVGHLTSDADVGEDKLEKGAKKFGKDVLELARFFEEDFFKSLDAVNIKRPTVVPRATEHIEDQIALVEALFEKGYAYKTPQAIYFDVSKFADYNKLSGQDLSKEVVGAREEVYVDANKRNPQDFVLWFFTVGKFKDHILRWNSPWGEGFPGWHLECSAMSMKYLGLTLDIHTGGVDHIAVHHTNEIAQSEAATGQEFVKYWVHHEHLLVNGEKMSKSKGNMYTIEGLKKKKYSPLAYRYLTFQTHYRAQMNFTWESLTGAQAALDRLYEAVAGLEDEEVEGVYPDIDFEREFQDAVSNDLNMPKAISVMWEMIRSPKLTDAVKRVTIYKMDEVLGLSIEEKSHELTNIPGDIIQMVEQREHMRKNKMFSAADKLRADVEKRGYLLKDTKKGVKVVRRV